MDSKHTALLPVFTALCIGIQLAPRPPNVEFTSFICFLVGVLYGCVVGGLLGALTMFLNGFLSPWGFAGVILPFQIVGMSLFGVVGGIYGRFVDEGSDRKRLGLEAAAIGVLLTLTYDLLTNFGFAVLYGLAFLPILIFGAPFSVIHICCNSLLLAIGFPPLFKAIRNFKTG